ncbi:tail fiber assembly protein [Pseudomonas sp. B21-047]|uniref:tail fiber assembly protein n=1 Tax=Pseudomonas TaxID=286 RepID=UPI00215EFC97|nr:tail fiber assembly protein [Pseudomonas sp. B21-047]UVL02048.1 tail fiber assembly protein [Pseudomonas sp. B21-047]
MRIKLSPVLPITPAVLTIYKQGDSLTINGLTLDFSPLPEGATLPAEATRCPWVIAPVERLDGLLAITLQLPIPIDATPAACFPHDIVSPADGLVVLPIPAAEQPAPAQGFAAIDWGQLVTVKDKAQAASEQLRATATAEIAQRRTVADAAIAPLQDAVELDDATPAEAEALKAWKRYRVALNRLPEQPGYPATIDWPALPA